MRLDWTGTGGERGSQRVFSGHLGCDCERWRRVGIVARGEEIVVEGEGITAGGEGTVAAIETMAAGE